MKESIYLKWIETKWPLVKNSDDLLAELANDYYSTYGQTACCPEVLATFHADILREYSQHLENIKLKELMSTEPRKFVLKANIVKYIVAENTYYTNDNITDEIAERMLAISPRAVNDFEVYPDKYKLTPEEVVALSQPQEEVTEAGPVTGEEVTEEKTTESKSGKHKKAGK